MSSPRAVVVGGSLSGLFTGISLLHLGFQVTILERSTTLQDAGAGIVLGGDLLEFLRTFDADKTNLAVESKGRVYLDRDDHCIPGGREDRRQLMSSWDALYYALRSNFDGGRRDGSRVGGHDRAEYKTGCHGKDIAVDESTDKVTVTYLSGGVSQSIIADVAVIADGASSEFRKKYAPRIQRTYAGYLGFRGLAKESELPAEAHKLFDWFSFFHSGTNDGSGNSQLLTYLIPGPGGDLTPGKRSLNWVWYQNYRGASPSEARNTLEEEDLEVMLTDKDGFKHEWSIPAGAMSDRAKSAMERKISNLPPSMQAVVRATEKPFIQAITDVSPPASRLVYGGGHVLFVGDAVVGPRPHTAAATNQGALHALTLFHHLHSSPELAALHDPAADRRQTFAALEALLRAGWEKNAAAYARMLFASGKEMGDRSQFGIHPFSIDKPVDQGSPVEKERPHHHRTLSGVAL